MQKGIIITLMGFTLLFCALQKASAQKEDQRLCQATLQFLKPAIMKEAAWAVKQQPVTITAFVAKRSRGDIHEFFSEGDYWWPDSSNPAGPYVRRDGQSNPDNFVAHRHAVIRFSKIIGALAAAYKISGQHKYVRQALKHAKAWLVDTSTWMRPNLLYAQAIHGRYTGRSIGVIDGIQLMEVAQGLRVMEKDKAADQQLIQKCKDWFAGYLHWLTTHPYGLKEKAAKNNHGTCWVMQVACFARFTQNKALLDSCITDYKKRLLPDQMAENGAFPLELERTKPYGYSIFNLDAMATICQILSGVSGSLWNYHTPNGRSIHCAIKYLFPYIKNKDSWPLPPDLMYDNAWPVAQPFLLFASLAYHQPALWDSWRRLDHHPKEAEVIRNLPVRHPLIWMEPACVH